MNRRFRWIVLLSVAPALFLPLAGQGMSPESLWEEIYKSAWAGIYTDDQASRGESMYRTRCASCHGASLEGSDDGPPLAGPDFTYDWDEANIADLFEKIRYTMPGSRPGRLSEPQIAEVLSYILKANHFPAGRRALSASPDDLRGVRFLAQNPER
jgi:mono/diheme cytochrome c family protein